MQGETVVLVLLSGWMNVLRKGRRFGWTYVFFMACLYVVLPAENVTFFNSSMAVLFEIRRENPGKGS